MLEESVDDSDSFGKVLEELKVGKLETAVTCADEVMVSTDVDVKIGIMFPNRLRFSEHELKPDKGGLVTVWLVVMAGIMDGLENAKVSVVSGFAVVAGSF